MPGFKNNHSIIRASAFTRPNNTFTRPIRIFGEDERPFIIGTTSCFKPQKNLQDLIKIFSAFVKTTTPNARLEILGDGQQREKLENLAKEQGVADLITFAGWQSDIAPWLARWDVFALTSLWEGLPCATVEARLFKLPVIAYNTGGIKDIIFNNQNGFLVAQYDKESFLACLQKCYSDCAYYNQLASHNDDLEAFKIETMVNQHIKLYKKLSP